MRVAPYPAGGLSMFSRSTAVLLTIAAACGGGPGGARYKVASRAVAPGHTIAGDPKTPDGNTHVHHGVNPWVETAQDNLSTFAADVDTASYTLSRRTLNGGKLPDQAAVRV